LDKRLPIAILAGGLATRLRPVTEKIPKALVEVAGQPFIAHQLRLLKKRGFSRIVICAWYRGDLIEDFVGNGSQFGLEVSYSSDGDHPLGTGGAIKRAIPTLGDSFFVLYGDSYLLCDYHRVQEEFLSQGKPGLMTVCCNAGLWDSSNVVYEDGQILSYDKKNSTSDMHYIDYGLGVFQRTAFDAFIEGQAFDLTEVYQLLLRQNRLGSCEIMERFYETGSFEGLQELDTFLSRI
jgi:NDP-sugar pyrophosphorylase family protein